MGIKAIRLENRRMRGDTMKIQITDREHWLAKVNITIQDILNERSQYLAEYNALPWYRRIFSDYDEWSQMYAWYSMAVLRRVKDALESEGTGDVYIDDSEMREIL